MSMHRIERHNASMLSAVASKSFLFVKAPVILKSMHLVAGLYKPTSISLEHGLILSSIAGLLPIVKSQLHGKRQKRTVSLNALMNSKRIWPAIDKITTQLLPKIGDFQTPKFKKPAALNYTIRLKRRFNPLIEFEELVSESMYDTHKGVFLPLSIHINFQNPSNHLISEQYLRMLRLPFNFYSRREVPAFDDPAVFSQDF